MIKGYIAVRDNGPRAEYQKWIDKNVPADPKHVLGLCRNMSDGMAKAFPELRVVGASYHGIYEHAWCVNKNMEVVDPTAHQFQGGKGDYSDKPMELSDFPEGKCMNCGELIYPDTPRNVEIFGDEADLGPHNYCDQILAEEFSQYTK